MGMPHLKKSNRFKFPRSQNGIALIAILLLFVMVVMLAVGMIERQELTMKRAKNTFQREELKQIALGIEVSLKEMTLGMLNNAKKLGGSNVKPYLYFNPLGFFATPLPGVDEYDVAIHISDPRGRLNLNELSRDNEATRKQAAENILRSLLLDLSFEDPNAFIQEVKRWLDQDMNVSDPDYESRDIPHKAGHQPLVHFSELNVFEWLTEKDREQQRLNWLGLYVDVLPLEKDEPSKLNVNTACKKLLASMFTDCPQCTTDLLKERDSGVEEAPAGFMGKGFREADKILEVTKVKEFYEEVAANNPDGGNAPENENDNTNQNRSDVRKVPWPKDQLGVMTDYLDIYIRVQRKGTDSVFDMKTRFKVDQDAPKVEVAYRNYSPIQPITLANQRVCLD